MHVTVQINCFYVFAAAVCSRSRRSSFKVKRSSAGRTHPLYRALLPATRRTGICSNGPICGLYKDIHQTSVPHDFCRHYPTSAQVYVYCRMTDPAVHRRIASSIHKKTRDGRMGDDVAGNLTCKIPIPPARRSCSRRAPSARATAAVFAYGSESDFSCPGSTTLDAPA